MTETTPVPSDLAALPPRSGDQSESGVEVGIRAVAAVSAELNATTYSRRSRPSYRLAANTESLPYRGIMAPPASAGYFALRADSCFSRASMAVDSSKEEPVPTGGVPMRDSRCHSGTCVGNMSCRAFLSVPSPDPVMPTSSP